MNVEVRPAAELSAEHRQQWHALRDANPELASPYFHPEFTAACARAFGDVEVAIVSRGGEPIGFFPFHRRRFGLARPVGDRLSDYHGIVAAQGARFDARELLRACKLNVWTFDHLVASQLTFQPFFDVETESPIIDLSEGFEAYLDARKQAGSKRITQLQRKARKIGREVGPVRLEMHVADGAVLDDIIRWKSEQCRRTNVYDFFRDEAPVCLVRDVAQTRVDGFEGLVSVLYAGDRIAAAHMGMRSGPVLHWWFPTYEHALSKYSPGGVLLLKLAEQAAAAGVTTLDLGKGEDPYKDSFRTGAIPLLEGAVDVPSAPAMIRRARIGAERWLRSSVLMEPVRRAVRALRDTAAGRAS